MLQIAPLLDRVGFRALDFTSSTAMGVAVRTHREDPWERIRLTRAAMPDTPLQFIGTGFRFISWELAHPEFMQLVYERLVAAGIDRGSCVLDPMHDMDAARGAARGMIKRGRRDRDHRGADVHDQRRARRRFLRRARRAARGVARHRPRLHQGPGRPADAGAGRDADPRAAGARSADKPLELHSHATIGLSPLTYLVAPDLGVSVLQTGCGALADGLVAARRAARGGEPARARAHRSTSTTGCSALVARLLRPAGRGRGPADRRAAATSTRRSCATRSPAA